MTHMVTRCPKCATAFRITTTQLESAKGAVRCGSCLHIFKASDDLISTAPKSPVILEPEVVAVDAPADELKSMFEPVRPVEAETDDDEIFDRPVFEDTDIDFADDDLISDDMDEPVTDKSSYEFEGYMDIDLSPTPTVSLFEREIQLTPEVEIDAVDESWAEELLSEDAEFIRSLKQEEKPQPQAATPSEKEDRSREMSSAIIERHSIEIPDAEEYARINQAFSTMVKAPLFSIVDEKSETEEPPEKIFVDTPKNDQNESDLTNAQVFGTGFFRSNKRDELGQKTALKSQPPIHANQDSRAALLMNIVPSPIEMTARRLSKLTSRSLWAGLSIVATVIFIAQIAYFKFDTLSRHEPYRTVYAVICPVFGCKLPGLVDTNKIVAYQLILRNHPTARNALLVDVMIRNDASFEQPFPDLVLAFTTLDNAPVASRRFSPKEYLGGELAGMERIPSKQPVHITLELSDPGPQAVNYHMAIAP